MSNHHLFYTNTWPTLSCIRNRLCHQWIRTRSRGNSPRSVYSGSYLMNGDNDKLSQTTALVASLKRHREIKMGFFHAFYGLLFSIWEILTYIKTPVIQVWVRSLHHLWQQQHWSYHYLISLFFSIINSISFFTIIGFRTQDGKHMFFVVEYIH